jgi:hypothetical protein
MTDIPATFKNQWPDRTKRAYETIALHFEANKANNGSDIAGHWVAIRLSDGGSDGVLYPSKMHAANYQLHEKQCAYICLPPFGQMSIKEIHRFLEINEQVYDAGGRLEDEGTHIVPGWL